MSDDKDHGFTEGEHNSGENVSQGDINEQPGISGWQGGVADETDGTETDPDEPAVR
jgi:hypothetical protein